MILLRFLICQVLIETSWNVKRGQVIATPVENIVLIETSWNVKAEQAAIAELEKEY